VKTEIFSGFLGLKTEIVCRNHNPLKLGTSFVVFGHHYHILIYREVKAMLVLSRKEGEQLLIGDNIVLTISRISGNRVAIGIEAPRDVRIVRGELERHEVSAGGAAPNSMPMHETTIAVASKPEN
jgi:carbon storage regulator